MRGPSRIYLERRLLVNFGLQLIYVAVIAFQEIVGGVIDWTRGRRPNLVFSGVQKFLGFAIIGSLGLHQIAIFRQILVPRGLQTLKRFERLEALYDRLNCNRRVLLIFFGAIRFRFQLVKILEHIMLLSQDLILLVRCKIIEITPVLCHVYERLGS